MKTNRKLGCHVSRKLHKTVWLLQSYLAYASLCLYDGIFPRKGKAEGISCVLHCILGDIWVSLHSLWGCTVANLTCIIYRLGRHFMTWDNIHFDGDSLWTDGTEIAWMGSCHKGRSERKDRKRLRLCIIVPPPLYSQGSWLKDRQGYGLFFPFIFW